jgi:hypothetical protein
MFVFPKVLVLQDVHPSKDCDLGKKDEFLLHNKNSIIGQIIATNVHESFLFIRKISFHTKFGEYDF